MSALKTYLAKLDTTYGGTSSVDNFTRINKIAYDATETAHRNLRHSNGSNWPRSFSLTESSLQDQCPLTAVINKPRACKHGGTHSYTYNDSCPTASPTAFPPSSPILFSHKFSDVNVLLVFNAFGHKRIDHKN